MDRELVSSLQGTLLQLKVRRHSDVGAQDYVSGGSRLDVREGTRAAREQKQDVLSARTACNGAAMPGGLRAESARKPILRR